MAQDRLLVIGAPNSGKITFVNSTFDSCPIDIPLSDESSHEGIIHHVQISTKYFTTGIDIWIDETEDFQSWCEEFSSDGAKEARDVIKGIVYTFKFSDGVDVIIERVGHLKKLIEKFQTDGEDEEAGEQWDGFVLGVGFGAGIDIDEDEKLQVEDALIMNGITEMVVFEEEGKNEFGEALGKQRIRQIIECHDWTTVSEPNDDEDDSRLDPHLDLDIGQILNKLNIAKNEISTLQTDEEKHKYAKDVIENLEL